MTLDNALAVHVLPELGAMRLSDLRRGEIRQLVDRLGQTLSGSRVRSVVTALRSLYRWAQDRKLVADNPAAVVRLPAMNAQPRERVASPREFAQLLSVFEIENALPLALAAYATARRQELRLLRWGDVDLDGGAVRLGADSSGRKDRRRHASEMRSLAVYEPPYTGQDHPGPEFGEQLDELVTAGRRDKAAEQWLAVTGAPPAVIASIKSSPGWPHMQALAHTLSRDLRLVADGRVPVERFERIDVPVLALAGEASAPWAAAVAGTLVDAIPGARERILEGQHHVPADAVLAAILQDCFR